ncbi:MAG: DUF1801 domain-containing protein [Agriterribacter sp.]
MSKKIKTSNDVLTALEYYYEKQNIPTRECLLALKAIILSLDKKIVHTRKFQIPFFTYNNFSLGFLWVHKKKILVGFIEDRKIFSTTAPGRTKNKMTTVEIDPAEDIPVDVIRHNMLALIQRYNDFAEH